MEKQEIILKIQVSFGDFPKTVLFYNEDNSICNETYVYTQEELEDTFKDIGEADKEYYYADLDPKNEIIYIKSKAPWPEW